MGLMKNDVEFLIYCKEKFHADFMNTATIGRQCLYLSEKEAVDMLVNFDREPKQAESIASEWLSCFENNCYYGEPLLKWLGAKKIDSFDYSDYESATCIHDLNQPLPQEYWNKYSLVLDCGTLEHIFHFPTALCNIMQMTEVGGCLVLSLHGNNWFGHGFYQFSPELFSSIFQKENGFELLMMAVNGVDGKLRCVASPLETHRRVEVENTGKTRTLLRVVARRTSEQLPGQFDIKQSDYLLVWNSQKHIGDTQHPMEQNQNTIETSRDFTFLFKKDYDVEKDTVNCDKTKLQLPSAQTEVDSFEKLCEYVKKTNLETLLHDSFLSHLVTFGLEPEGETINDLAKAFDSCEFAQLLPESTYFINFISDIKNNIDKYLYVYEKLLMDEISKSTFFYLLKSRLFLSAEEAGRAYTHYESQYFLDDLFDFKPGEVFLDCGGYTGETTIEFIHKCPDYKKVHVFEASHDVMLRAEKALKDYCLDGSVVLHENAVGSAERDISFSEGSQRGDGKVVIDSNEHQSVKEVRIDDVINDPVTIIKMDIEGYEENALIGASEIIQRDTPKMMICLYHLASDFWKLPMLVESINCKYKFYIRHLRKFKFHSTVMYCVPTISPVFQPPVDSWMRQKRFELLNRDSVIPTEEDEGVDVNVYYEGLLYLSKRTGRLEAALAQRETDFKTLENALAQQDTDRDTLTAALAQRSMDVQTLEAALAQRETDVKTLEAALAQRETDVKTLEAALQAKTAPNS